MSALADDLQAYLEERVVSAHETGSVAELRKWVVRNKPLAASLAPVLALVGGVLASQFKADEAERQEAMARRDRDNVLRLSAAQELADLSAETNTLWPAIPEMVPRYDAWLARAAKLGDGLEPSPDGTDRGHRRQLELLRERSAPRTVEADRRSHPRFGELQYLERKLAWMERARAVREGHAEPERLRPGHEYSGPPDRPDSPGRAGELE